MKIYKALKALKLFVIAHIKKMFDAYKTRRWPSIHIRIMKEILLLVQQNNFNFISDDLHDDDSYIRLVEDLVHEYEEIPYDEEVMIEQRTHIDPTAGASSYQAATQDNVVGSKCSYYRFLLKCIFYSIHIQSCFNLIVIFA